MKKIWIHLLAGMLVVTPLVAKELPADLIDQLETVEEPAQINANHFISYDKQGDVVTLKSAFTTLVVNTKTLGMEATNSDKSWTILPPSEATIRLENGIDKTIDFQKAGKIDVKSEEWGGIRGVRITLSRFVVDKQTLDLRIVLFAGIEWATGDLVFELRPIEKKVRLRMAIWPGSIDGGKVDSTVIPHKAGLFIPRNWPKILDAPYQDMPKFGLAYCHTLYMPWWGFTQADKSAMVLLDTPFDGGCYFYHSQETGTLITPKWIHSLGKMDYTRRAKVKFVDGNYVDMAKAYRQVAKENGNFRSLNEKIVETPKLANLIGVPIYHGVAHYYDKARNVDWAITFEDHMNILSRLIDRGFTKGYMHLDGVGYRGYDNLEPDQLPIGKKAGGKEKLKNLMEYCKENNWLFAFHQQYRDMFVDSPSYNENLLALRENGTYHYESTWAGGKCGVLCSSRALDYVRRNNSFLAMTGLKPDGCYLDVFSIVYGDECYDPEHRVNRQNSYEFRRKGFDYIRSNFGIVSSEEPSEWAIRSLSLVHHVVYGVSDYEIFAIPLPLLNLVYHDAIIIPFETTLKKGSYYVSKHEVPFLHAILNAGMPYINMSGEANDNEAAAVKVVAELHGKVATLEMTDHKMLTPDGRQQQSTYADGSKVTVNLENGDFEIDYKDKTVKGNALNWKVEEIAK